MRIKWITWKANTTLSLKWFIRFFWLILREAKPKNGEKKDEMGEKGKWERTESRVEMEHKILLNLSVYNNLKVQLHESNFSLLFAFFHCFVKRFFPDKKSLNFDKERETVCFIEREIFCLIFTPKRKVKYKDIRMKSNWNKTDC